MKISKKITNRSYVELHLNNELILKRVTLKRQAGQGVEQVDGNLFVPSLRKFIRDGQW